MVKKHEQMPGQRVPSDNGFRQRRQTVEALAKVGRLQADEHGNRRGQREHCGLHDPAALHRVE